MGLGAAPVLAFVTALWELKNEGERGGISPSDGLEGVAVEVGERAITSAIDRMGLGATQNVVHVHRHAVEQTG